MTHTELDIVQAYVTLLHGVNNEQRMPGAQYLLFAVVR